MCRPATLLRLLSVGRVVSRGVIGLVELAGAVVFAAPVAFFGLLRLLEGDLLVGGGFLCLAAAMVAGREYVTSPRDLPAAALERVAGRVAKPPDDED